MCSVPVTFGGGSRMVYGSPLPDGLKWPAFSHASYNAVSKVLGS